MTDRQFLVMVIAALVAIGLVPIRCNAIMAELDKSATVHNAQLCKETGAC